MCVTHRVSLGSRLSRLAAQLGVGSSPTLLLRLFRPLRCLLRPPPSTMSCVFLLALPLLTMAAPLYDNLHVSHPAEPLQPLAIALALVPFPLIALLKVAYLRFRRGQSIHALDSPLPPRATTSVSAPMSTAASVGSSLAEKSNTVNSSTDLSPEPSFLARQRQCFWIAFQPYLVGFLGSPDWEVTISCRITNTLRREARHAAVLVDSSTRRSTSATNPSTAYSTLSTKSRGTSRTSRSNHRSVSLVDKTRHRLPNDFAFMPLVHPSSPPPIQLPPPAHLPTSSVRFSVQQNSPTLMQIMEPVLSSWYDDSIPKPPLVLVNDKSITTTDTSQDRSTSAEDSCASSPHLSSQLTDSHFSSSSFLHSPRLSLLSHPSFPLDSVYSLRPPSPRAPHLCRLFDAHYKRSVRVLSHIPLHRCLPLTHRLKHSCSDTGLHAFCSP